MNKSLETELINMIPEDFLDLVNCPRVAALTTMMPDGQPQTTVVWCNYDGEHVLVNTMRGFRKEKNMRQNPKVTLLAYDPSNTVRYIEVRGEVVEMTAEGALEHLDNLCELYTGVRPYFGACVPAELKERETPVLCKVRPTKVVTLDAVRDREKRKAFQEWQDDLAKGGQSGPADGEIPASHVDLLVRPVVGVFTTMMADGQPQSSLVWCDYDGERARVNTSRERQKGKNMAANPKVNLLVVDPDDTSRYLEIRGEAELVEAGAVEHLDKLTREYTPHPYFYGYVYPEEKRGRETRVICRIRTRKITRDAIHR